MIIGSSRILTSVYLTYFGYLCVSIFVLHSGVYMRPCTVSTISQETFETETQIICETQCLHNLKPFPLKIKYKYTSTQGTKCTKQLTSTYYLAPHSTHDLSPFPWNPDQTGLESSCLPSPLAPKSMGVKTYRRLSRGERSCNSPKIKLLI